MRLAEFIVSNIEPILSEWEVFARGITPGAKMDALALRDHASDILLATVADMKSSQTATERSAKSRGAAHGGGAELNGASEMHAIDRLDPEAPGATEQAHVHLRHVGMAEAQLVARRAPDRDGFPLQVEPERRPVAVRELDAQTGAVCGRDRDCHRSGKSGHNLLRTPYRAR